MAKPPNIAMSCLGIKHSEEETIWDLFPLEDNRFYSDPGKEMQYQ